MSKPFQALSRHLGTALRQRPGTHRPPGGRLYPVGYLHALPAPERIRRDLGLRQRRARRAHHHQGPQRGRHAQQIVDRYHQLIKSSFEGLGMSFDIYSRTSSKTHAATARSSSASSTTKANSSSGPRSNTTTRRPRRSSPTAISWAPAPAAASRSMRARRTLRVRIGPAVSSSGKMTASGRAARRS